MPRSTDRPDRSRTLNRTLSSAVYETAKLRCTADGNGWPPSPGPPHRRPLVPRTATATPGETHLLGANAELGFAYGSRNGYVRPVSRRPDPDRRASSFQRGATSRLLIDRAEWWCGNQRNGTIERAGHEVTPALLPASEINLCRVITAENEKPVLPNMNADITASDSPKLSPRIPAGSTHV